MLKLAKTLVSILFMAQASFASANLSKTTLAQARLQLPFGDSFWPIDFPQRPALPSLELAFVPAPGCEKIAYRIDYLPVGSPFWLAAVFQNGFYRTNGQAIQSMRVWLNQRVRPQLVCDLKLQHVHGNLPQPPAPGTYTYAGLINYQGGFALNQTITLPAPSYGRRFDVLVPEYCKGVEVIELGVKQQGQSSKASLANPEAQTWLLPQISAFDEIQVSLNGPIGQECQIPIYFEKIGN